MADQAQISIIVPCFNAGEYLHKTLNSVLAQTVKNWECIMFDDGSTDETESVAREYCTKDDRFSYLKGNGNHGPSYARNRAIEASGGTYILPLDSDDKIAPELLAKASKILDSFSDVKLVCCQGRCLGNSNDIMPERPYELMDFLRRNPFFPSTMFRRFDYDLTGGYDEDLKYGEDWELWINILSRGGKAYRIEEELFYYRQRDNSLSQSPEAELRFSKTCVKLVQKYPELYEPVLGQIFRDGDYKRIYEKALGCPRFIIGGIILAPFSWLKKVILKK